MRNAAFFLLFLLAACGRSAPAPVAYGADPFERTMYRNGVRNAPTQPVAYNNGLPQGRQYVVRAGDNLPSIARRYGTTTEALAQVNGLSPPYPLAVGRPLAVPVGHYHRVRQGETLYSIARQYNTDLYILAEVNSLRRPFAVSSGQTLKIPGADGSLPPPPTLRTATPAVRAPVRSVAAVRRPPAPPSRSVAVANNRSFWPWGRSGQSASYTPKGEKVWTPTPPPRTSGRFAWPVRGRVVKGFGSQGSGGQNDGINIAAPEGTPVRAAENGVVAYANDSIRGYGNMVLLKHSGGWITAYAHNSSLSVRQGQTVSRGQVIARVGNKGTLHFEVRSGKRPVNPLQHLEVQRFAAAAQNVAANRW
jgi:murein DD-endopeptidase MepM/ murein hydrolase activator NlpD